MTQDLQVYSAMQTGKPYKSYKKTILGKVQVIVLNPFSQESSAILLEGEEGSPDAILDVWSEKEDAFFKRMNRRALETGRIISFTHKEEEPLAVNTPEQMSDEEVKDLIKKPFLSLRSILEKTESEAFVYRILKAARDAEKSEKFISAIEARLGEIQSGITEEEE